MFLYVLRAPPFPHRLFCECTRPDLQAPILSLQQRVSTVCAIKEGGGLVLNQQTIANVYVFHVGNMTCVLGSVQHAIVFLKGHVMYGAM